MEWDLLPFIFEFAEGSFEVLAKSVSTLNEQYYKALKSIFEFGAPIATICAGAFAIRQKLLYAERNMHIRLAEYLNREEKRLKKSEDILSETVQRPGPSRELNAPIFVEHTLKPSLKAMKWGRIKFNKLHWTRVSRTSAEIETAISELNSQLDLWDGQKTDFKRRKFRAHLIKGAIAASKAAKHAAGGQDDRAEHLEALGEFEQAVEMDPSDLQAIEYAGHQRVRLADQEGAHRDFERMEKLASEQKNGLAEARALKFAAQLHHSAGTPAELDYARQKLNRAKQALPACSKGGIEEAEICELLGRVQFDRETYRAATNAFTDAERLYNSNGHPFSADGLERVRAMLQRIRLRPLDGTPDGDGPQSTVN